MKNLIFSPCFSALARSKVFKAPDKTDPTGSHYQVSSSFAQEEETSQHQCPVSGCFLFYLFFLLFLTKRNLFCSDWHCKVKVICKIPEWDMIHVTKKLYYNGHFGWKYQRWGKNVKCFCFSSLYLWIVHIPKSNLLFSVWGEKHQKIDCPDMVTVNIMMYISPYIFKPHATAINI